MSIDTTTELLAWQPPIQREIISDGILLPETAMIVFGPAKSWKSILALHTAHCISSGRPWLGFNTSKCTTFRYQVELPKAIDRKRVAKYMNGDRPDNMLHKTSPYSKIDTSYGLKELMKDVDEVKSRCPGTHVVLILDPVYLLISGHISDDYDVKRLLDNLNELRSKCNVSLIIIHHSHKTRTDDSGNIIDLGSEDIMGSSYFNNWADTMVKLKTLNPYTGADRVELSFGLARHAEALLPKLTIQWSRANLHPSVLSTEDTSLEEEDTLPIHGLQQDV